MASNVLTWPEGTPSITSIRCKVAVPTPDACDKSPALHRSNALAARIWALDINLNYPHNDLN